MFFSQDLFKGPGMGSANRWSAYDRDSLGSASRGDARPISSPIIISSNFYPSGGSKFQVKNAIFTSAG